MYHDIDLLREKATVSKWLVNLKDGTGRKQVFYCLARCLRWCSAMGLESVPTH